MRRNAPLQAVAIIMALAAFSWVPITFALFLSASQIAKIILLIAAITTPRIGAISCIILLFMLMFEVSHASPVTLSSNHPIPSYWATSSLITASGAAIAPDSGIFVHLSHSSSLISGAKQWEVIVFGGMEGLMILSVGGAYAWRAYKLKLLSRHEELTFSRLLLNLIYVCAFCFVTSAFFSAFGFGMKTDRECNAAIQLCLVFYLGGKVMLYFYLVERLRAIRQTLMDRSADILWQRCFFGILIIFGEIAVICFFYPVESTGQGYCTIGLPTFITIPMLIFDVGCNLAVSWIFYRLSRKEFTGVMDALISPNFRRLFYISTVNNQGQWQFTIGRPLHEMAIANQADKIMAYIIRKTLVVSICILGSTITNLVLLFHFRGAEHGWMCFMFCSLDISWNVACVTYLIGMPTSDETFKFENVENVENITDSTNVQPQPAQPIVVDPVAALRNQLSPPRDFISSFNAANAARQAPIPLRTITHRTYTPYPRVTYEEDDRYF